MIVISVRGDEARLIDDGVERLVRPA